MLNPDTAPSIYWKTNLSRPFKISLFIFSENVKKDNGTVSERHQFVSGVIDRWL